MAFPILLGLKQAIIKIFNSYLFFVSNGISYLIRIETVLNFEFFGLAMYQSQMAFPILLGLKQSNKP